MAFLTQIISRGKIINLKRKKIRITGVNSKPSIKIIPSSYFPLRKKLLRSCGQSNKMMSQLLSARLAQASQPSFLNFWFKLAIATFQARW